jgi:hypothetical protein
MKMKKVIALLTFVEVTFSLAGCSVYWPALDRATHSQVAMTFGCGMADIYKLASIRPLLYEGECGNAAATSVTKMTVSQ